MGKKNSTGACAYCGINADLQDSHAIPAAAFASMLRSGSGKVITIPGAVGNAGFSSDTGAAPLLCRQCERDFNVWFDGPLTNALKNLQNRIDAMGSASGIDFSSDQLSHALVSVAWRMERSSAEFYSGVELRPDHRKQLEQVLRLPQEEILRHCSVRLCKLQDHRPEESGGFGGKALGQLVKRPEVFLPASSRHQADGRFIIDWTMFGFLVQIAFPRLPYSSSRKLRGLKRGARKIVAPGIYFLEHKPLANALFSGLACHEEGRLTPALKKRNRQKNLG